MTVVKSAQTQQALGAILNLIRYKRPETLDEAAARPELINQIAVDALGGADMTDFITGETAGLSFEVIQRMRHISGPSVCVAKSP